MKKHIFGVLEQGMISFFNFLIIVIYSRQLSSSDFALFVILFSTVTLAFLITTNFCAMPIQLYLENKYKTQARRYIRLIMKYYLLLSFVTSSVFLGILDLFVRDISWQTYLYSVLFSIVWGCYEIIRKIGYTQQNLKNLFVGSVILVLIFSVNSYFIFQGITISNSFMILCIAYSFAILANILLNGMRKNRKRYNQTSNALSRQLFQKNVLYTHWKISKWPIIGTVFYWISTQGYMIFLSYFISDIQLGAFRTAMNLLGLITILLVFFENMYTPIASKEYFNNGVKGIDSLVKSIYTKAGLPLVGITFLATVVSYFMYSILFGKQFASFSYLTIYFGMYQLLLGLNKPALVALLGMENTRPVFIGNLLNAVITVFFGLMMSKYFHVIGAVFGVIAAATVLSVYLIASFWKTKRGKELSEAV
ncbi:MAG: hypothetical protein ABF649_15070 [Bacillus sp. (in: firmicutes)]